MTTVLAIDQGTSGTKAIVVDPQGRIQGLAEQALKPVYLPDGGVEQDPIQLLNSVLDAGRAAGGASGHADRHRHLGEPGGERPCLGFRDRPAALARHRLAGPPLRGTLRPPRF